MLGVPYESADIGKEDVPPLQDRAPQARGARHLQGSTAQAAAGLNSQQNHLAQAIDF